MVPSKVGQEFNCATAEAAVIVVEKEHFELAAWTTANHVNAKYLEMNILSSEEELNYQKGLVAIFIVESKFHY
jgi:hypothetical protein